MATLGVQWAPLVAAAVLASACLPGPAQHGLTAPVTLANPDDATDLVLIGDTGTYSGVLPGDESACDAASDAFTITADCRARMRDAMRDTHPDAVLDLGDLVYFSGPRCDKSGLTAASRGVLDDVLGSYLEPIGVPVLLALGNHDLAQRHGRPAALRCYQDYATEHDPVVFPERTYTVDLGGVFVVVVDSNRPPGHAVLAGLRSRVADYRSSHPSGWVLVAGHHPVRTYRDNAARPQRMRRWLDRSGLTPDVYAQGHAHFLQHVDVDGLPVVTSGAGAKSLPIATCRDGVGRCGPGERFSYDAWGFVTLHTDPQTLRLDYRDVEGTVLYTWSKHRGLSRD